MKFTKMQGAGNDFVILDAMEDELDMDRLGELAKQLCARRRSIGADGMMVVVPPKGDADYGMLFFNADGSMGEMCGNGARCICRYGYEHGLAGEIQRIETTAGLVTGTRIDRRLYRIRLNDPSVIDLKRMAPVAGTDYEAGYVELGNPGLPHAVVRMEGFENLPEEDFQKLGSALRYHEAFPKGANVTFCHLNGENRILARTYERGVEDFTLACGTGCGATVTVLTLLGLVTGENTSVTMPGGELFVTLTKDEKGVRDIYLTGPTNIVAEGEVRDEDGFWNGLDR